MEDLVTPAATLPTIVLDAEPDSWERLIREAPFVVEDVLLTG